MATLNLADIPLASLKPNDRNARTHSDRQIRKLASSIQTFGFNNPILIDQSNRIIAGHGRVEAARLLGWDAVPSVRIEHLTDEEMRAYILADNRLAELAGWDDELLRLELGDLVDIDLDFDLSVTGFELPEIDVLLSGDEPAPFF